MFCCRQEGGKYWSTLFVHVRPNRNNNTNNKKLAPPLPLLWVYRHKSAGGQNVGLHGILRTRTVLVTKGMSLFVYKIKKCLALFNDTELGSFILDRFSHPPCHSIRM